jgi:hypothetical protein
MVGTVNAHRDDVVRGVDDMTKAEARFPGWLGRLLTHRIDGLGNYEQMLEALEHGEGAIKVYVEVAGSRTRADRRELARRPGARENGDDNGPSCPPPPHP